MTDFNNSIITKRRLGTSEDPFVSLSEAHIIENSVVQLSEIPDQFNKVTVTGQSITWAEQISGIPTANTYVVDYNINLVIFHSSREGMQLQFDFKGTGLHYIPIDMIYSSASDGEVITTMRDVVVANSNASTVLSNLNASIATGGTTNSNLISSISSANITKTALNDMNIIAIATEASLSSANVVASEATRIQNESVRIINEGVRVSSEVARVSAENLRKSAEDSRLPAEINRNNAESTRIIAENLRIAQNNNTIDAENVRVASENTRIDKEIVRTNSENTRISQESSRVTVESSRVGAENTRVSQEVSRVGAENTRVNSENVRLASEISRVGVESARVGAENIRESNEITRLSQENARVISESVRISSEITRESNEDTRQSNEVTRESQETNRQSTYSSGHIKFKGIVTGIASLPASDNILGDTYQVIDDAITANNAMWRYNGTIFEKSYVLDLAFAGGYGANDSQVFTSTENQTVFTLTEFPYLIGVNQLLVYVTGIKQIIGVNYTETSTNSFTLTSGVVVGTKVEAFRSVPGGAGSLTTQEVENARVSSLGVGYENLKARLDDHDSNKVGVLANLNTSVKTDIVSAINEQLEDVATYQAENSLQLALMGVSVKNKLFGAKGDSNEDGTVGTDDTLAIQAAINYTYVNNIFSPVDFPKGIYRCASFNVLPDYLILYNKSFALKLYESTILRANGDATIVFDTSTKNTHWTSGILAHSSFKMRGISLKCTFKEMYSGSLVCISGQRDNLISFTLEKCKFKGTYQSVCMDDYVDNFSVSECEFESLTGIAPRTSDGVYLHGGGLYANDCRWCKNGLIENNKFLGSRKNDAIEFNNDHHLITDFSVEMIKTTRLIDEYTENITICNNYIANYSDAGASSGLGIGFAGASKNIKIHHNTIENVIHDGIHFEYMSSWDNGDEPENIIVSDNILKKCGYDTSVNWSAVNIFGATTNYNEESINYKDHAILISGNVITDININATGISLYGASDATIIGNKLKGVTPLDFDDLTLAGLQGIAVRTEKNVYIVGNDLNDLRRGINIQASSLSFRQGILTIENNEFIDVFVPYYSQIYQADVGECIRLKGNKYHGFTKIVTNVAPTNLMEVWYFEQAPVIFGNSLEKCVYNTTVSDDTMGIYSSNKCLNLPGIGTNGVSTMMKVGHSTNDIWYKYNEFNDMSALASGTITKYICTASGCLWNKDQAINSYLVNVTTGKRKVICNDQNTMNGVIVGGIISINGVTYTIIKKDIVNSCFYVNKALDVTNASIAMTYVKATWKKQTISVVDASFTSL